MCTTSYQDFHIVDGVLCAYTGRDEVVTVPQNVHTIGEGAFKACVSLKKVILPRQLCHILSGAFKGCRKLKEINIPDHVLSIGDYAFHRCHALTSIILPPSVEELGDCVFLYCDSLIRAEIPGVKHMGGQVFVNDVSLQHLTLSPYLQESCICDVFTGCSRLSSIAFFHGETFSFPNAVEAIAGKMPLPPLVHAVVADVLRMMELEGRCLVKFLTNLKHVEIPEGIEQIGKSCFFDKRGILSVTFPTSLKEIESRAFRNCISLESLRFKSDKVLIHKDAFKNCSSLKEVCTSEGSVFPIEGISLANNPFLRPAQALVQTIHQQVLGNFRISGTILLNYLGDESRVLVPEGITCIAEEAFAGKESIERVILPSSLQEIGAGAFRDCLLLQTIPFPESLCRIGEGAFEHCVKLLSITLPEAVEQLEAKVFKHCHKLKEFVPGTKLSSIGEQAFCGCQSLKEISFPKSLTSIGAMAFYRCASLKEVCLLPELKKVGNLAFAQSGVKKVRICGRGKGYGSDLFFGCLGLRTLILEDGVRHIPDKFAYGCTALNNIIFPKSYGKKPLLASIGRNVWEKTPFLNTWMEEHLPPLETWRKKDDQDGILWDGRSLAGEVRLPEYVQMIAGGAFYGNEQITSLWIPDGVTWIGPAAFKGCSRLRRVVWPAHIKTIEPEVFSGCTSLEEVETSGNWLSIRERAFYRCHSLKQIPLDKVVRIGKEAFSGCSSLSPALLSLFSGKANRLAWVGERAFEDVGKTDSLETSTSSFFRIGSIVISGEDCAGNVCLPEGITVIAPYAFAGNRKITHLVLPDSLQTIGEGAFWGCSGLLRVDFPSHVHSVGSRTFEKCASLVEIKVDSRRVGARAFACCTSLVRAELYGLDGLGNRVFEHCISLEVCNCTPYAKEPFFGIGDYCFSGCESLRDFDFSFVGEIGCYSFEGCDRLIRISFKDQTRLRPHAFQDCGGLEEIRLTGDRGEVDLCEYALSGCTALKRVVDKKGVWVIKTYREIFNPHIPQRIRLIFHSAFSCFVIEQEEILKGYRGLGRIVRIPYGIRRIEAEVFRDVLMLKQVEIPETVEFIGARAFHGTAWLEEMRRKNPMVVVNHMLLEGSQCKGEVVIPQSIRLICGWAFAGGLDITGIRFLSDRVRVDAYAFRNCIYLKEIALANGTKIHVHGIADRKRELVPLAMQVIMESLNCFKTDEDDNLIECTGNISRLLVAHGVRAVGDYVFQESNLLTEILLPSTVTSIGKFAFFGCKWLKAVKQAQSVKTIGERAFSGCGVLERIELSQNLTSIGTRAFENCTSLKEILLPEGLKEIPDRTFFRCHSLARVVLPSTLKRIGKEAFAFCRNLEMPHLPEGVLVEEGAFVGIHFGQ